MTMEDNALHLPIIKSDQFSYLHINVAEQAQNDNTSLYNHDPKAIGYTQI